METAVWIIIAVGAAILAFLAATFISKKNAASSANLILEEAKREAEVLKEKKLLKAKEEEIRIISEAEKTANHKLQKIQASESRARQKENQLNQQQNELNKKRKEVDQIKLSLETREQDINEKSKEIDTLWQSARDELERISGLSAKDAKDKLI